MECIKVYDETFHYPSALTWLEQKSLVKIFLKLQDTFYIPKLQSGHSMNLKMTCLGSHWSAKDYKYHNVRADFDQQPVPLLDPILVKLASKFTQLAFPQYNKSWDIAICNQYDVGSTLGLHKDNSESLESLQAGDPIVSFSVGARCNFQMGGFIRSNTIKNIELSSGDVLIFGGQDRLRYHGVNKIYKSCSPFHQFLNGGRVNFTLRKL